MFIHLERSFRSGWNPAENFWFLILHQLRHPTVFRRFTFFWPGNFSLIKRKTMKKWLAQTEMCIQKPKKSNEHASVSSESDFFPQANGQFTICPHNEFEKKCSLFFDWKLLIMNWLEQRNMSPRNQIMESPYALKINHPFFPFGSMQIANSQNICCWMNRT